MTYAVKVFIISCLLQGSLCQDWAVIVPWKIHGLSGSCVAVPCTFTMPPSWDFFLDDTCRAIWQRGWRRSQVYDSSLTGDSASTNLVQGNLTGNLKEKDCTTIFTDLPAGHRYSYYFRIQCDNSLKFNFQEGVELDVQDSLPQPNVTQSPPEVEDGSTVTLSCSAFSPCPAVPPALTWKPTIADAEESAETGILTANFTASSLQNEQTVTCSATYSRQNGGSDYLSETNATLRVLYAPMNTVVDYTGPVEEGSTVTLTCNSSANPAVDNYTWYKKVGDAVTMVGSAKQLSTVVLETEKEYYCKVSNSIGNHTSAIAVLDVLFRPKDTSVSLNPPGPTLEGSSVSMLCITRANPPVTNYIWYKDNVALEESGSVLGLSGLELSQAGSYHCEAKNDQGAGNSTTFNLDVQYPPKNTTLVMEPSGSVQDGETVTLTCSSIANPDSITFNWYRVTDGDKQSFGSGKQTKFNVTKLSEDQYLCEATNAHGREDSEPIFIDVTFPPEILTSSRCVKISSQVRCSCDGQGNPPPSLVWEISKIPVNHSDDIPIRDIAISTAVVRSIITLHGVDDDMPPLVCVATNPLGSDSYTFNVTASETTMGLHPISILIGCAVGALAMLILCAPVLFFCSRKKRGKLSTTEIPVISSGVLATNQTSSSGVAMYSHEAIADRLERPREHEMHYANVEFARMDRSGANGGGGEIRGLSSRTDEYAEIQLNNRGRSAGGEEIQTANTLAGQEPRY